MRNTNRKNIHKLALLSILTSASLILSYVEAVIPPIVSAVPGIKLGFPNILIIYILYRMGIWEAIAVSFVRILLGSMLFGTPLSFVYSVAGAILSLAIMVILKKTDLLSIVGVSVAGAVFHNLGQILMAMLLLGTTAVGYYLIILSITGTIAGIFIGLCGALMIKRLNVY